MTVSAVWRVTHAGVHRLFRVCPLPRLHGLRRLLQLLGAAQRPRPAQRPRLTGRTEHDTAVRESGACHRRVIGPGRGRRLVVRRARAAVFGIARDTGRMSSVFESVPGGAFAAADITRPQACADAVGQCVQRFGRLDNAGQRRRLPSDAAHRRGDRRRLGLRPGGQSQWTVLPVRAALPHLLETGGNIVNVASVAGVEGEVYSAGYCAPNTVWSA